jgi:hypothetical protein
MFDRANDPIDGLLSLDPAHAYAHSHPQTQALYRARLIALAQRAGVSVEAAAQLAIEIARRACTIHADPVERHVGYYLLEYAGLRQLESRLGIRLMLGERIRRFASRRAESIYIVVVVLMALGIVGMQAIFAPRLGLPWTLFVLGAVAVLAVSYSTRSVRAMFFAVYPRRPVARLSNQHALRANSRVLIVIPAILSSREHVETLMNRLVDLSAEHPEPAFRFALLGDFGDAPAESMPGDDAILQAARGLSGQLNAARRDDNGDRFFVLHRRRKWSETQGAWIGWERKRGKLLELNRMLRASGAATTFEWIFGDFRGMLRQSNTPYVITLDESGWLDSESTWMLIGAAAHPLNRPSNDESSRVPRRGYGIVQAAVVSVHARSARRPPPRSSTDRSFPFDPTGAGLYYGQGALLDVASCGESLDAAFPEDRVLHHDLLEGFVARTCEVHGASVLQERSRTYFARLMRGHRWLRGTFQLLSWVLPQVRDATSRRVPNSLRPFQRFYLLELALRELRKPAAVVLLLWVFLVRPPWLIVWIIVGCPPLFDAVVSLVQGVVTRLRVRAARPVGKSTRVVADVQSELFAAAFGMIVLAIEAVLVLDAVARVVWRSTASQKKMLDWVPRSAVEEAAPTEHVGYWRVFWPSAVLGTVLFVSIAMWQALSIVSVAPIALAWVAAPSLVWCADHFVFDPA